MFPFRKAYRGLKSLFQRKKKAPMKHRMRSRPRRHIARATFQTKKTVIDPRLAVNGNANSFGSDTFELGDIPQYSSFIALYEEFRIDKIVYSFKALNNVATTGITTPSSNYFQSLGMIHTVIDTNDNNVPGSIQDMMNDQTYKGSRSSRNHTRVIRPKFLNVVGASGNATQQKSGWLTCTTVGGVLNATSHYGIKWCLEGGTTNSSSAILSYYVEPIITYYISFRNPK